jgi:hypothetical protein
MAAKKLFTQPDILNLDSLGAFMDAQNDTVGVSPSEAAPQSQTEAITEAENPTEIAETAEAKSKAKNKADGRMLKVAKAASGKTRPRINKYDGNDEWSTVMRYAGFYNDNSTAEKTTVAMNSDIKTVLEIIHNSYRGEINCGNLIDAICRAFIERNKEQIMELAKSSRNLF